MKAWDRVARSNFDRHRRHARQIDIRLELKEEGRKGSVAEGRSRGGNRPTGPSSGPHAFRGSAEEFSSPPWIEPQVRSLSGAFVMRMQRRVRPIEKVDLRIDSKDSCRRALAHRGRARRCAPTIAPNGGRDKKPPNSRCLAIARRPLPWSRRQISFRSMRPLRGRDQWT